MITVFCVHWIGDFRKRNYTHDHVERLYRMVEQNLTIPHQFICLTNDFNLHASYEQIPLLYPNDLRGWWAKLELFRGITDEKCLYLDLDTFICGNLNEIASFGGDGITFMRPVVPFQRSGQSEGKRVIARFQSSCFTWTDEVAWSFPSLESLIEAKVWEIYRGDQDYFGDAFDGLANTFPPQWFTKLGRCWETGPNPEVKVVLGNPKPLFEQALNQSWVQELLWISP